MKLRKDLENHCVINFKSKEEYEAVKKIINIEHPDYEAIEHNIDQGMALFTARSPNGGKWTSHVYGEYLPKGWGIISASNFIEAHKSQNMNININNAPYGYIALNIKPQSEREYGICHYCDIKKDNNNSICMKKCVSSTRSDRKSVIFKFKER